MNLLKKYTPHEMMEMTIRDIKRKQMKRERDINAYQFIVSDNIKKRCRMRRKSSGC
ncbi:hypothetical protein [Clostridium baratii]|uniref:Uncharacterized protein n=1 Tax=Clostridium baratii TaxID=1561 RepID=A0A174QQQ3_9CLOT|nr:hypothetical protein [Clostridium baratii]CUP73248.1 Uncharacterised protein [Clostridium baratii]